MHLILKLPRLFAQIFFFGAEHHYGTPLVYLSLFSYAFLYVFSEPLYVCIAKHHYLFDPSSLLVILH